MPVKVVLFGDGKWYDNEFIKSKNQCISHSIIFMENPNDEPVYHVQLALPFCKSK